LATQPLEESYLHRPALALLSRVASQLLSPADCWRSRPFSWSRSFLLDVVETPRTPTNIQRCPWHTPEVIPTTRSVCDMVCLTYLLVMSCILWVLLSKISYCFHSLLFRSYRTLSFYGRSLGSCCLCTLQLLCCGSHSCHNCETSSFGLHICSLYHPRVIMSVCYCTHLLHLRTYFLYPLSLILFLA
jgi:hypothetical protein